MEPRTLEALKASIAKWERNATAINQDAWALGRAECPLCDIFNNRSNKCLGCPVFERTQEPYCRSTPYSPAVYASSRWSIDSKYAGEAAEAARAEVAFLKSLLPTEEAP